MTGDRSKRSAGNRFYGALEEYRYYPICNRKPMKAYKVAIRSDLLSKKRRGAKVKLVAKQETIAEVQV